MVARVTVRLSLRTHSSDSVLLIPAGIATGLGGVSRVTVKGADIVGTTNEVRTGQPALFARPNDHDVAVHYDLLSPCPSETTPRYPSDAFRPIDCPATRAASELADTSIRLAREAGGGRKAVRALIAEASARFTYGHPDVRFNDGLSEVPFLACSIAEGSCVDINSYLIASLRAANIDAAYLFGYFFPEERNGYTVGAHCWVATRAEGVLEEWDIAHHKKMGTEMIGEGLNPKPGCRFLIGHSMSHLYDTPYGRVGTKLLASPLMVHPDGSSEHVKIEGAWLDGDLQQAA